MIGNLIDFNSVLKFSENLIKIHKAFTDDFFLKVPNFCTKREEAPGEYEYSVNQPIKCSQMYTSLTEEYIIDINDIYFISFNPDSVLEIYINAVRSKVLSTKDVNSFDISEEGYFQGSTIYEPAMLNSILIASVLNRSDCGKFYFDLDYYDLCVEYMEKYNYVQ